MTTSVETIDWDDFEKVLICAGTVLRVEDFPEARKPAWRLWVDFGPHGIKKTSAQIKALYQPDELIGKQIVGVINFPPRQVGKFQSEFLLTGFASADGVVITTVERPVANGARLVCGSRASLPLRQRHPDAHGVLGDVGIVPGERK